MTLRAVPPPHSDTKVRVVASSVPLHAADADAGASGRCCCARVRRHILALKAYVMASFVPPPAADAATGVPKQAVWPLWRS